MSLLVLFTIILVAFNSVNGMNPPNPRQKTISPQEARHPGNSFYNRGVGLIPDFHCRDDEEKDGLLCYPRCQRANYNGVGPVCWEKCQSDEKDKGPICFRSIISWRFKDSEGRGVGRAPSRGCGDGRELHQGLCYKRCDAGWKGVGVLCFYVGFN